MKSRQEPVQLSSVFSLPAIGNYWLLCSVPACVFGLENPKVKKKDIFVFAVVVCKKGKTKTNKKPTNKTDKKPKPNQNSTDPHTPPYPSSHTMTVGLRALALC